jgi:hypothetical protein
MIPFNILGNGNGCFRGKCMRLTLTVEERTCVNEQRASVTSPTMMCVPIMLEVLNHGIEPRLDVIAVARPSWGTEEPRGNTSFNAIASLGAQLTAETETVERANAQQAGTTAAAAMDG